MSNKQIPKCFLTPDITKEEVRAIKALAKGEASEYQQQLALSVICNKLSRAQDNLFIPESDRESAFLSGRAFVGQQVLKYIKVPINQFKFINDNEEPSHE